MVSARISSSGQVTGARPSLADMACGLIPDPPYPGIRPFDESEWPIFFGREEIIDDLLARLSQSRFVAMVGTSGSGKSSVVRAGLFSTLKRRHAGLGVRWRTTWFRPGNSPMWCLAEALYRAVVPEHSSAEPLQSSAGVIPFRRRLARGDGIGSLLKDERLPREENVLLLVDQFEELFRYNNAGGEQEVRNFLDQLVNVVEDPPEGVYLALTMRADFLGECERYPRFAQALNQAGYLLRQLKEQELRDAIALPAGLLDGEIEAALVDRLIDEAASRQYQLPLIQHALRYLWHERARTTAAGGRITLTIADYDRVKGLAGALSDHADATVAALPEQARAAVEPLFLAITRIDADGRMIRRPLPFGELVREAAISANHLRLVIDSFREPGRSFLMPPSDTPITEETPIDIGHEALIHEWRMLRDWVNANREFQQKVRRLRTAMDEWKRNGETNDHLLPDGPQLKEARDLLKSHGNELSDVRRFIVRSRRASWIKKIDFASLLVLPLFIAAVLGLALSTVYDGIEVIAILVYISFGLVAVLSALLFIWLSLRLTYKGYLIITKVLKRAIEKTVKLSSPRSESSR